MGTENINTSAGAEAGKPAAGAGAGASAAENEQSRSKAFEAAEHHKNEAATLRKELEAVKAEQKKSADERLAKQGEYQTLAEQRAKELEAVKAERDGERVRNALILGAQTAGLRRMTALPLAEVRLGKVNASDAAALSAAVTETFANLSKEMPELFGAETTKTNNATTKAAPPGAAARAFDPADPSTVPWGDPVSAKAMRDKQR